MKQDLTQYEFTIFSCKENNQLKYTYAIKGNTPMNDKWESVCTIGRDKYSEEEIINIIKKNEEETIW